MLLGCHCNDIITRSKITEIVRLFSLILGLIRYSSGLESNEFIQSTDNLRSVESTK
jgi:hypothetical protein